MPVAAREPQESLPNSSSRISDELSIDDGVCLLRSYTGIEVDDELGIEVSDILLGYVTNVSVDDELSVDDKLCHFFLIQMLVSDEIDVNAWHNYSEQYGDIVQNYVPGSGTGTILGEIDGGSASSVYLISQIADGGGALWL
jgi:hypothetical protein